MTGTGPLVLVVDDEAKVRRFLRAALSSRGYRLVEVDLDPFILSGGAAYCMTLRLDRASAPAAAGLPGTGSGAGAWASARGARIGGTGVL